MRTQLILIISALAHILSTKDQVNWRKDVHIVHTKPTQAKAGGLSMSIMVIRNDKTRQFDAHVIVEATSEEVLDKIKNMSADNVDVESLDNKAVKTAYSNITALYKGIIPENDPLQTIANGLLQAIEECESVARTLPDLMYSNYYQNNIIKHVGSNEFIHNGGFVIKFGYDGDISIRIDDALIRAAKNDLAF